MNNILSDKVSIITGGGSGIGAAIAIKFANLAAKVAIFDIDERNGKNIVSQIEKSGGTASYYNVDVSNKEQITAAVNEVMKVYGNINSWINSAGVSKIIPFLDCPESLWDQTIDVNLKGTFLCCQVAIKNMLPKGGSIINFSSVAGKKPCTEQTAYCASKYGVIGLSQSVAKEFANKNIRVNVICPGIVETPLWDKGLRDEYAIKRGLKPDEVMDYFLKEIPMERLCSYQDIVNTAIFLTTDMSSYLTGQSINLVGGAWMD